MNKKQQVKTYLNNLKIQNYYVLVGLIILSVGTLLLMGIMPLLFFLNPLALLATGGYLYFMLKRFKFIESIDRMLNYDDNDENIKKRVEELLNNLSTHMNENKEKIKKVKPLYLGELAYKRASSNTFIENNIDYKISKKVYEIYNNKK